MFNLAGDVVGPLPITVPRSLQRLTGKFILEVSFSVLVTLSAAQIVSHLMAAPSSRAEKVDLRAAPPPPVKPAATHTAQSIPALDPNLSAFMEKAALSHVATARPEEITPAASPAVSAEVWAAAQRRPSHPAVPVTAARPASRLAVPLPPAAVTPSPVVTAISDRDRRPIPIIAAPPVVQERMTNRSVADLRRAPPPPVDESLRPPADLAPRPPVRHHEVASRFDGVTQVPMRLVSGVADVGQSIGHSIGSLFHRF